jgi:hypothetical protein
MGLDRSSASRWAGTGDQEGNEMTFATVAVTCARRRGVLAGALTALVSLAAAAPCVQAAASSSHSHSGHGGAGHSGGHTVPASPNGPRNWLASADGTLHTAVGVYTDCSGASPIPADTAAIDTCVRGRTYFVGHNVGVFTPLMHMSVGSVITWYDSRGVAHPLRVVAVRDTAGGARPLNTATRHVDAQFQTCAVTNGSVDRILDAVRA